MENLINELCTKTGVDRATAEKVVAYLKENATRLPELLGSGGLGITGKVGEVMGR
jgi:hypothetical protein